jgi:hypothetical protein
VFHVFYAILFLVLFFSQSFGAGGRCGTVQFAENLKNPQKKMLAKNGCAPESLYGRVEEARTSHFIIYYTREKAHAIKTMAFIDSLKLYLEQAYKLHKDSLGMKGILGASQTYHYQKSVPAGFYPVEVVDTGLLRNNEGDYYDALGLTFSPGSSRATQIVIENDFLYGANCFGRLSNYPFIANDVDYSVYWNLALKVVTFHELYHSFQISYYNSFDTFWLEASATGVEEIAAPEIHDYIGYLSNVPGKSTKDIDRYMVENDPRARDAYGYASLYLFLFSKLGPRFDSYIWDYFSRYGREFTEHLARLAGSRDNAEDLFHEYATSIFYSGKRASLSSKLFWSDMPKWPEWRISQNAPFNMKVGSFDFVRAIDDEEPNTTSVARKTLLEYNDSAIWVFSRLLDDPPQPRLEFAAYPNPWNPKKNNPVVYFKNLPLKSKGVEIRSANGALIERISRKPENGEEPLSWQPKKLPAPGILYYRHLPHGQTKPLILEY